MLNNFIFCRSYGQKIVVVANGEKGDISEVVEKLAAYLATHVRNKQDSCHLYCGMLLSLCQYEILTMFQKYDYRETWSSSCVWPPPWLRLRLSWASGRLSWRRLACQTSPLSSGPMDMRSPTRRTCGIWPFIQNTVSQMYALKVFARELWCELLHDWGKTSWNVHRYHGYLGVRRGEQLGTSRQTDSCELFLSDIALETKYVEQMRLSIL